MPWVTTQEVQAITLTTVTESQIVTAQFLIEIYADTTEDSNEYISSKNLRLLKMAVAYQAAWMTEHPDAFYSISVTSGTQDGMSWTIDNPRAGVLAPLAEASIKRLSWKRNRNIYINPARRGRLPLLGIPDEDNQHSKWTPLD